MVQVKSLRDCPSDDFWWDKYLWLIEVLKELKKPISTYRLIKQ
jgi:hypothetical protein